MGRTYGQIHIDSQVLDLLHKRRQAMSSDALRADQGLGIGATIAILLEHWEQHPPDLEWIRKTAHGYPSRGRPRKSETGPRIYKGGKHDVWRGHDFVIPQAHPHMHFCKDCEGFWDQHDYPTGPLGPCPTTAASRFRLMKRKKQDYLLVGFTADEVTWAPE